MANQDNKERPKEAQVDVSLFGNLEISKCTFLSKKKTMMLARTLAHKHKLMPGDLLSTLCIDGRQPGIQARFVGRCFYWSSCIQWSDKECFDEPYLFLMAEMDFDQFTDHVLARFAHARGSRFPRRANIWLCSPHVRSSIGRGRFFF
jgi:hypothetical protein